MKSSSAGSIAAIEPALKDRFGTRFPGLELSAVEEVFWPVFSHRLNVTVRTKVSLDPFEEGLLRVLSVRPMTLVDVARYLGIGGNLASRIVKRLEVGETEALVEGQDGCLHLTAVAGHMLETLERPLLQEKTSSVFRDALFDEVFEVEDDSLEFVPMEQSRDVQSRWLDSIVATQWNPDAATVANLAQTSVPADGEVVKASFQRSGALRWIRLHLGCFASDRGRKGRLLLFNPAEEDRPLDEMSLRFEALLIEHGVPALYHPRDPLGTAESFWRALAAPLLSGQFEEQHGTVARRFDLVAGEYRKSIQDDAVRFLSDSPPAEPVDELRRKFVEFIGAARARIAVQDVDGVSHMHMQAFRVLVPSLAGSLGVQAPTGRPGYKAVIDNLALVGKISKEAGRQLHRHRDEANLTAHPDERVKMGVAPMTLAEWDGLLQELVRLAETLGQFHVESAPTAASMPAALPAMHALVEERDRLSKEMIDLKQRLARLPETRSIRAQEHQSLLDEALRTAKNTLIIVSPWIRLQVLERTGVLAGIAELLRRRCEVWIGHGMPRSNFHRDSTDPEALKRIDDLRSTGRLFRVGGLETHEKLLICDDSFHVTTSYNWLSYDGRQSRYERGQLVRGQAATALERDEILNRLRERLGRQRNDLPQRAPVPPQ